jgi:hypothetical protein
VPAAKPSFPALQRGHPLAQGLVLAVPMGEGSGLTTYDLSGNDNHGTLVGGATWAGGQHGWSIALNGTTGYGSVPSGPSLPDGSAPMTVACWLKPTLGANNRGIITRTAAFATGTAGWRFNYQGTGTLRWDTSAAQVNSTFTMTSAAWNHVAATVEASTVTFYLNGVAEAHASSSLGTANTTAAVNYGTFSTTSGLATGNIDAVALWNRALSADEVAALYFDSFAMYRRPSWRLKAAGAAAAAQPYDLEHSPGFQPLMAM